MKSPSNITTIINESSTKLSSVTNHVSKSKSLNPTLTNKNELVISRIQKHIKEFNNEINIQSKNEINTSIKSTSVISLNKDDNLVKNNPQIVNYDQPNCLNNDRQLVDHKDEQFKNILSLMRNGTLTNEKCKFLINRFLSKVNKKNKYMFNEDIHLVTQ